MRYGFETKNGDHYEFFGQMTLSIGDGQDLSARYGYDASKRPQSIVWRKRKLSRTGSIQIACNRTVVQDLFAEMQKYEDVAGGVGDLWWDGQNMGVWCIKDVSLSLAIDAVDIIYGLQISMNIAEGYVRKAESKVQVSVF